MHYIDKKESILIGKKIKKLPQEIDALRLVEEAIKNGARGIAFGRNIFQAKDPKKMIDALREIVKNGAAADEAADLLR